MTLKDIANSLNVSPSTVSLVLNDRAGVSQETRERVRKTLQENGYLVAQKKPKPNQRGNIRFLKFYSHAKLVDGNERFVSAIIDSVEREARERNFNLLMTSFGRGHFNEVFAMLRQEHLQGLLILGPELDSQDYHKLTELNMPVVVVDNYIPYLPVDSVVMNNREIVFMALSYLKSMGHSRIGYVHSQVRIENFHEREIAFKAALDLLDLPYLPKQTYRVDPTMQGAFESMDAILKSGAELPTALFADNDIIALGCMRALKGNGYQVPRDISIIGFDDIPFGTVSDPPLTTMRVPTDEIGRAAIHKLCYRIDNPDAQTSKTQFSAKLVIRESVGPPKA